MYGNLFESKMKKIIRIERLSNIWQTKDPFLFCAYHNDDYPKWNGKMWVEENELIGRNIWWDFSKKNWWNMYHWKKVPWFPQHPHRWFETITINKQWIVDHFDSLWGQWRFWEWDVEWMTAWKWIQHSEMFPLIYDNKNNPLELFQVWLNLPKKSKFVDPYFNMLWKDSIPHIIKKDNSWNLIEIDIIAWSIDWLISPKSNPNSWASDSTNKVRILTIKLSPNSKWLLDSTEKDINRTLYFYKWNSITIEKREIISWNMIELKSDSNIEIINWNSDTYILLLEWKPINEKVVQYGPFVMNTDKEIAEAYKDYEKTQFGWWSWANINLVHSKEDKCFAIYNDDRKEFKTKNN